MGTVFSAIKTLIGIEEVEDDGQMGSVCKCRREKAYRPKRLQYPQRNEARIIRISKIPEFLPIYRQVAEPTSLS